LRDRDGVTRPSATRSERAGFHFNIDSVATGERPVHTVLLGRDIPIVEHMRGLKNVPERGGRFSAVPVKVKGFGTFPVRAYVSILR